VDDGVWRELVRVLVTEHRRVIRTDIIYSLRALRWARVLPTRAQEWLSDFVAESGKGFAEKQRAKTRLLEEQRAIPRAQYLGIRSCDTAGEVRIAIQWLEAWEGDRRGRVSVHGGHWGIAQEKNGHAESFQGRMSGWWRR